MDIKYVYYPIGSEKANRCAIIKKIGKNVAVAVRKAAYFQNLIVKIKTILLKENCCNIASIPGV